YSESQTMSPLDARTSTLTLSPSLYLRQVASETSQLWSPSWRVSVSRCAPARRAPITGSAVAGGGAPVGDAGWRPVPDERRAASGSSFQRWTRKLHQSSSTASLRCFGLHFLTTSNVPSFLSCLSLWHSSPSSTVRELRCFLWQITMRASEGTWSRH